MSWLDSLDWPTLQGDALDREFNNGPQVKKGQQYFVLPADATWLTAPIDEDVTQGLNVPERISLIPTTSPGIQVGSPTVKEWEAPNIGQPKMYSVVTQDTSGKIDLLTHRPVGLEKLCHQKVVSLIIDEYDLFDDSAGIFVPGITAVVGEKKSGNYYNRGKVWEKMGVAACYELNGEALWQSRVGVRIHGDLNRAAPQKSLRFYLRDGLLATDSFYDSCPIDSVKQLVFKSANNSNNGSHFTDVFVYEQAMTNGLEGNYCEPVHFFINGEYWGMYHMRLRQNKETFKELMPHSVDSLYLIDNSGKDKDWGRCEQFDALVAKCNAISDFSEKEFQNLSSEIDIQNAVDYLLINAWFGNRDWITNNVLIWKPAESGKWNWALSDLEATMLDPEHNLIKNIQEGTGPHAEVMQCLLGFEEFRSLLNLRYNELSKKELDPTSLLGNLADKRDDYAHAVLLHRDRWPQFSFHDDWYECLRTMEVFIAKRDHFFSQHLAELNEAEDSRAKDYLWLVFIGLGIILLPLRKVRAYSLVLIAAGIWSVIIGVVLLIAPEAISAASVSYPRNTSWFSLFYQADLSAMNGSLSWLRIAISIACSLVGIAVISRTWIMSRLSVIALASLPILGLIFMSANTALFFLFSAVALALVARGRIMIGHLVALLGLFFSPMSFLLSLAIIIVGWRKILPWQRIVLPVSLAGLFALMIMSSADLSSAFLKIGCESAPHWPLRSQGTGLAQYLDLAAFAFSCFAIVILAFRRRKWAASWWSDRVEIQISWLYLASCCLMFLFQGETPIGTHVLVFASPMGFAALYALSIAPSSKRNSWVLLGFLLVFLAFESYWHIQVQLLFTLTALTLFAFLWLNDKRKWLSITIAIVLALGLILVQYSLLILSLNGYWIG